MAQTAVVAAVLLLVSLPIASQRPSWTISPSAVSTGAIASEPGTSGFPGFPELSVLHSACGLISTNGTSYCSPASSLATPAQFTLSNFTVDGDTAVLTHEQYFGVKAKPGSLIQYTISGSPPQFQAYFDNRTSAELLSMKSQVADYKLEVLANASENEGDSGQLRTTQAGFLIFRVSDAGFNFTPTLTFTLRNATGLNNGIRMSLGSPIIHMTNISGPAEPGSWSTEFVGLEEWPLTIFSNSTTSVELGAANPPPGVWAKFLPTGVVRSGPDGTNVTLLLAGALEPLDLGNRATNPLDLGDYTSGAAFLFIDALGSNGLAGESILPIVPNGVTLDILRSPAPILFDRIDTWGGPENVTTEDVLGAVYDPGGLPTPNQTLGVRLSVDGLVQNGTLGPLPSWIQVTIPQNSFELTAGQPFYFYVGATVPSVPVDGVPKQYAIVLSEVVGGKDFYANLVIDVDPEVIL